MPNSSRTLIDRLQRSVNLVHSPSTGWVVFALSLVLTFAAYWFAHHQLEVRAKEHFEFRSSEISNAIRERLLMYEQTLNGAVGLFDASTQVTRSDWHAYVNALHLSERLPGIQGLGYAVPVEAAVKEQFEARVQQEGFPNFRIKPEFIRPEYTSIIYLEPFDWRNQRAFGFDMWSNPVRREAMSRARDRGVPATSGIITLVQETGENVQKGFLTYLPVYRASNKLKSVEARREHFLGWVYAAFRAGDLMQGILGATDRDLAFEIYDGFIATEETLLFDSDGNLSLKPDAPKPLFFVEQQLELQGRPWTIFFSAPIAKVYDTGEGTQPVVILVAGIFIDTLLFYVIMSLHFVNRHAREQEQEMLKKFEVNQQRLALQARMVEASERESETFFELAPEAFLVVQSDGIIVKANHSAHKLFGFELGELNGINVDSLVPEATRANHSALRASFAQNPVTRTMAGQRSLEAIKRNGESFPATINLVPIEYRGSMHTVAAVHDVSIQKNIEQTLADAKDKAESASRAKSEFVANMSHEIRTPLNAVLGSAQLLEKTEPNPAQSKYIHMIRSSGQALLGVINDILDFSKIEAGCMELTPVSFDLNEILSRVAIMMSVNAGEKNIELVIHVDKAVPQQVICDPLRLQQVLINLISNAIKFTDTGSVVLSIALQNVVAEGESVIRFSVTDTGIGMNKQQISQLFKAFSQADGSITRRFGGTGLGLVISNKIVELMGGEIVIESEFGRGTQFYFDIRLNVDEQTDTLPAFVKDEPKQVVIVEDHPDTCASIESILTSWGWDTRFVTSLELLQSTDLSGTDIVLLDYGLVQGTVGQYVQQLYRFGLNESCLTLLMVGNNQEAEMVLSDVSAWVHGVITKPILSSLLLNSLQEASFKATGLGVSKTSPFVIKKRPKLKNVSALLVEDNVFNQTIARGFLEDMGVDIKIAHNGKEAIECVEAAQDQFDIIFMDIQMPVMDGVTATKILREKNKFNGPIIAMTAGVLKSEREEYLAVGMSDFVAKPIDSNDLFRAVSDAISSAAARGDTAAPVSPTPVEELVRPDTSPTEDMKVFNAQRLTTLTRGKPARIQGVIESLEGIKKSGMESLQRGIEAIQNGDYEKAHFALHSVKGVVANYGGDVLAAQIKEVEGQLKEQASFRDLSNDIEQLLKSFDQFMEGSEKWISTQKNLLGKSESGGKGN